MDSKLIPANGESRVIPPADGKRFSLEELQGFVGGYIQIAVFTHTGAALICNEEGKLMRLPRNEQATQLFRTCIATPDFIVGDAVLIAPQHQDKDEEE